MCIHTYIYIYIYIYIHVYIYIYMIVRRALEFYLSLCMCIALGFYYLVHVYPSAASYLPPDICRQLSLLFVVLARGE